MRKNIGNDKVIRAMVIGISAMLASSAPLTALAAEGDEGTGNTEPKTGGEDTTSSTVCDKAQAAADTAQDAVDTAEGSAKTVKDDVKENVVAGEAGLNKDGKDLAQNVIDAAGKVENASVENGTPLAGAETDITNADIELGKAETNDGLSNNAYDKADDAAEKAAEIAEDVNDAMNKANATVDEKIDAIENATSIADANAAYSELEETANKAQEDFDAKLDAYNAAKDAYDKAVKEIEDYEAAYNAAINNADENAAAAQAKLAEAKKNAAALEAAVAAAKDAVDASAADAMVIAEKEELTQNDGGLNWRNEDQLFIAIMEKYYLPEKLGIAGAKVTRIQGKDNNEYNYFTAEYVENGETKVKYYNFKMDGNSKDDIVIFEKREVEIFGGAADRYVDKDGNLIDTAAGVEAGTIVGVNDEYLIKNDATKSETLVSDSEVTGTSKEDIFVDEDNAKESWKLDEEGNLVKTVTADVTTITYTDATFTSDKSYATDAERDKAAADKKAELEEATGKDATITETETYVATGTYIPAFTETIDINVRMDFKSSKNEAIKDAKEEILDANDIKKGSLEFWDKDLEDQGYYLLKDANGNDLISFSNMKAEVVKDRKFLDDDYQVTGTATVTYAKIEKETISQSTLGAIWNDLKAFFGKGDTTNEQLEAAARQAVEAEGGIFIGAEWAEGKYDKATIRYVKGYKVETDAYNSKEDAQNALSNLINTSATNATETKRDTNNSIERVAYDVQNTGIKTNYSYTVDYLEKASETTVKNKTVATETYGNAEKLTGEIIQNKNYLDGKILLTQQDKDYRAFVDDAKALTGKYDRLLQEAKQANADVATAQKQVDALKAAIEDLKGKSSNKAKLADLEDKLAAAEANWDKAKENLSTILNKLEGAGVTLEDVINRLTPPTTPGGEDGTTTPTTAPTTTPTVAPVAMVATAAPAAPAAAAPAAPAPVVQIEEEETPLAPTIDEAGDNDDEEDEKETAIVAIEEEETPLVASVEGNKISWWWWLILLILGATGYEMYKKHEEKKKAAEEAAAKDAE